MCKEKHFKRRQPTICALFSGGYYSDDVGHVSTHCKKCPNGSYVSFEKAPGTQAQDCKSCPEGKE